MCLSLAHVEQDEKDGVVRAPGLSIPGPYGTKVPTVSGLDRRSMFYVAPVAKDRRPLTGDRIPCGDHDCDGDRGVRHQPYRHTRARRVLAPPIRASPRAVALATNVPVPRSMSPPWTDMRSLSPGPWQIVGRVRAGAPAGSGSPGRGAGRRDCQRCCRARWGKSSSATITRLAANPLPTVPTDTVTHVASARGH